MVEPFIERMKQLPGAAWVEAHPRLTAWFVLALGSIILLAIEANDVGLLIGQWIALIVAVILVTGACIWIITWDDEDLAENDEAS